MNATWNEICFLLSDNIRADISESDFEREVIGALRVLDWKAYSGDIEIRPSFPVGAANRITPDLVIKSPNGEQLFVIEIKQPNLPLNTKFQKQLFSYMRQLKLEYGILIGQSIQVFYDGNLISKGDPILLETIHFNLDNEKGIKFVELFSKSTFNPDSLKSFTTNELKKINRLEEQKKLTTKILSDNYKEKIKELIKQDFLNEYDGELIETALDELKIEVSKGNSDITSSQKVNHKSQKTLSNFVSSGKLLIEFLLIRKNTSKN